MEKAYDVCRKQERDLISNALCSETDSCTGTKPLLARLVNDLDANFVVQKALLHTTGRQRNQLYNDVCSIVGASVSKLALSESQYIPAQNRPQNSRRAEMNQQDYFCRTENTAAPTLSGTYPFNTMNYQIPQQCMFVLAPALVSGMHSFDDVYELDTLARI